MQAKLPTLAPVANGWLMNTGSIGVYGDYYLKRAIVSMVGLGANQPEDAIYPLAASDADGQPLDGDNDYVLHFTKDELPPVELAARSTRPVGRHHAAVRAPACRPPRTLGTPTDQANLTGTGAAVDGEAEAHPMFCRMRFDHPDDHPDDRSGSL